MATKDVQHSPCYHGRFHRNNLAYRHTIGDRQWQSLVLLVLAHSLEQLV
jgi:hypothetical protein